VDGAGDRRVAGVRFTNALSIRPGVSHSNHVFVNALLVRSERAIYDPV
jgi:hypothetical protein